MPEQVAVDLDKLVGGEATDATDGVADEPAPVEVWRSAPAAEWAERAADETSAVGSHTWRRPGCISRHWISAPIARCAPSLPGSPPWPGSFRPPS